MMKTTTAALAIAITSGAALAGVPPYILAVDSANNRVVALDSFDGSLVNDNFLDINVAMAAEGVTSSTAIEVLQVNNQWWVTDQIADRIWTFDAGGNYAGSIGVGDLNNVRGMEVIGNTVFVAMGSNSDTLSEGIVQINATTQAIEGVILGRAGTDVSYFDVLNVGGELYVTNIDSGNDGIERYSTDGTYNGVFFASDGSSSFDFGQQMNLRDNGNLLVGGFSPPAGVFEIGSDGSDLGIVAGEDFGPRGGIDLGNGEILWGNGTWIRTDDNIILEGVSGRFFTRSNVPTPGSLAVLGLAMGVGSRRRRR